MSSKVLYPFSFPHFLMQDMSRQPPTQELVAKDLHCNEWRFRHIFRGINLVSNSNLPITLLPAMFYILRLVHCFCPVIFLFASLISMLVMYVSLSCFVDIKWECQVNLGGTCFRAVGVFLLAPRDLLQGMPLYFSGQFISFSLRKFTLWIILVV